MFFLKTIVLGLFLAGCYLNEWRCLLLWTIAAIIVGVDAYLYKKKRDKAARAEGYTAIGRLQD